MSVRVEVDGEEIVIRSPGVGLWRNAPAIGSAVTPGQSLGALEVLGRLEAIVAPKGAHGVVVDVFEPERARSAVDYHTVLLRLDPRAVGASKGLQADTVSAADGLTFVAPMSGRFYRRPAPDKPPFVQAGDVLARGRAIGILEVMKTFNRVVYGGDELPEQARVVEVVPEDGADITRGDVVLRLEEIS